ncbi:MAG: gephyrin-like molybdotransferase Glp [Leucothrix sp.]
MNTRIETAENCESDVESDWITVDAALAQIQAQIKPINASVKRPLRDGLGQVLAQSIVSTIDVPGHTNSAMDGYALNGEDLPEDTTSLTIIGKAMAGQPFIGQCQRGECVRIMTGAIMPAGTDSVVMQEQSLLIDESTVKIGSGHRSGQNVRHAGEDIEKGAEVFGSGRRINAADLGVLASFGFAEIAVKRKVRVAFFSTGDELRSVGQSLDAGQIYDSNRYTLFGMLSKLDVEICDLGVIADRPEAVTQAFEQAANMADVVITSGGVSVGEADYIKPTLRKMGNINFWKIAMKPGRPLTYGQLDKAHFFGLPGNPVAVMVTFLQFVKPALQQLAGETPKPAVRVKAVCQNMIRKRPGRTEYQRGIYTQDAKGNMSVELTGRQGSGILTSMSEANCLIVLNDEQGAVKQGDSVLIELLD